MNDRAQQWTFPKKKQPTINASSIHSINVSYFAEARDFFNKPTNSRCLKKYSQPEVKYDTFIECMVGREGFEPSKAEPTGLQPVLFDHFSTDPLYIKEFCKGIIT